MLSAPCTRLYQLDFEQFRLFTALSDAFGTWKVIDGVLFGDNACVRDFRFLMDNKVDLIVSISDEGIVWRFPKIDYLSVQGMDPLTAVRLIADRSQRHQYGSLLFHCEQYDKIGASLVMVAGCLVLRFKWTMQVAI
jgi:hypothetical protein